MTVPRASRPATGRASTARRVLATTMAGALLTAGLSAAGALTAAEPALAGPLVPATAGAGPAVVTSTGLSRPLRAAAAQLDPPMLALSAVFTGNRVQPDDQFAVAITTDGGRLNTESNLVTSGSEATVDEGTGTTGAVLVTVGQAYGFSVVPDGTTSSEDYLNPTITCLDSNADADGQTGLPTGAALTGSTTVTPVAGAAISCTVSLVPNAPGLTLTRTPAATTAAVLGDSVGGTLTATNTGNVPLEEVTITDVATALESDLPVPAACQAGDGANLVDSIPAVTLLPGQALTVTVTHHLAQADLDCGSFNSTATVVGTPPGSSPAIDQSSPFSLEIATHPGLTITKDPATQPFAAVELAHLASFLVTNSGDVTLTGISVTGALGTRLRANDQVFECTGPADSQVMCPRGHPITSPVSLAPGATKTFTVPVATTQSDLDAGSVLVTATARGLSPAGDEISADRTQEVVPATQVTTLTVTVTRTGADVPIVTVGQVLPTAFLVTNTGNVTLTALGINDSSATTETGPNAAIVCPSATLAPGASQVCQSTYTVTQADMDNGAVSLSGHAFGTALVGGQIAALASGLSLPVVRPVLVLPISTGVTVVTVVTAPTVTAPTVTARVVTATALPRTGLAVAALGKLAGALLLLGAGLVLVGRRRRLS